MELRRVEPEAFEAWVRAVTYGFVPGAALPATGVTAVAVLPTHRRQGLMTGLMERLLADARERGDVVAALGVAHLRALRLRDGHAAPRAALARPHAAFRADVALPPGASSPSPPTRARPPAGPPG